MLQRTTIDVCRHLREHSEPLIALAALSVHSVFAGLALGIESTEEGALQLFVAIVSNKLTAALALGLKYVKSRTPASMMLAYVVLFAAITPAGVGIGMAVDQSTSRGRSLR